LVVTDSHGASNSCVALVVVQDTTPPDLQCPADITANATGPAGAVVAFKVQATDACSGPPLVQSVPASGSTFPIGTTAVTCTATDLAGNISGCQFRVTVLGPADMVQRLTQTVEAQCPNPNPLMATLQAASAALERNNLTAAVNQLEAFQNKVAAQVGRSDPGLARLLERSAQAVIAAIGGGKTGKSH